MLAVFCTHTPTYSLWQSSACPSVQFLAFDPIPTSKDIFLAFDQAVMDGLDSVEVAPAKSEGDSQSSYAAEEQLWRHEFFRDCLAPKNAAFKVNGSLCQHLSAHDPSSLSEH